MPYSSLILAGGLALIVSALISFVIARIIVATKDWHGRFSMDLDKGIQKMHAAPTPRIGGAAILGGFALAAPFLHGETFRLTMLILGCGVFAYGAGFVEDITKNVTPKVRLAMALLSGLIFCLFSGVLAPLAALITPDAVPEWVGTLLSGVAVLAITVFLAGTVNALNLIDGFHGLASGSMTIIALTIAGLAYSEGDLSLSVVSLIFAASSVGFLFVNFPRGSIFLGDGGAYFGGFTLGALAISLAARTDISPLVSVLIMAHPIYETLFSIVRKSKRKGMSPMQPDALHLHHLVSRRYARFLAYGLGRPELKNPLTGLLMWPLSLVASALAIFAQGTGIGAIIGLVVFAVFYGRVYRVVSLQRPSFLQRKADGWGWKEGERYAPPRTDAKKA